MNADFHGDHGSAAFIRVRPVDDYSIGDGQPSKKSGLYSKPVGDWWQNSTSF
jgi:hypothetical protein